MFRWFIRQYHLPFSLPETCAADILQGNACSSSLKARWQALQTRWAGFPMLEGRIVKGGRKQVVCWSLLQQTSPCSQCSWNQKPWFPDLVMLITQSFLAAAVPGEGPSDLSFLAWPPAWAKFIFVPASCGVLLLFCGFVCLSGLHNLF